MNPALSSLHTVLFINLLKFLVKSVQISAKTETLLPCKIMVSNPENDLLVTNGVSEQTGDYLHSRKIAAFSVCQFRSHLSDTSK